MSSSGITAKLSYNPGYENAVAQAHNLYPKYSTKIHARKWMITYCSHTSKEGGHQN